MHFVHFLGVEIFGDIDRYVSEAGLVGGNSAECRMTVSNSINDKVDWHL
jgi:hypothetical protein